jgi:hypothetical protein
MSNRPTFSILMFSLFALAVAACGGDPMAPDPFVAPIPVTTGPVTTGTPTTSSSSSGTAGAAQATTTSGPATTTGSAGAGGASGSSAMTTTGPTGAGGTAPAVDAGGAGAGGSTEAGAGCGTMCPPDAGSDAAAWADAKDGTIGSDGGSAPDAANTTDAQTPPGPETGPKPMKPALYVIIDRTYWSVSKVYPQVPGVAGWPIFAQGVKDYASSAPDAFFALQFEPIATPNPNTATPSNYVPAAVDFASLTTPAQVAAVESAIDAQPGTSNDTGACEFFPATQMALDRIAALEKDQPGVFSPRLVFVTRYASGAVPNVPQILSDNPKVPGFVISMHSGNDGLVTMLTPGHAVHWAVSTTDVATALQAIAAWQPPAP